MNLIFFVFFSRYMNIYTFSEYILKWFSLKLIVVGLGKAIKPGDHLRLLLLTALTLLGSRFSFKT